MLNGLYSIHVDLLDGRSGKGSGVVLFRNGVILGGDAYLYYTGSYTVAGDAFKGEVLVSQHTPSPDANPLFGGPSNDVTSIDWPAKTGYSHNIEKAKALMAESGVSGIDTTLSFDLGAGSVCEPIAVLVQESLAQIGIKTAINKIPGANWRSEMAKKSMPMMINFFSGWLDYPEYFFFWCYSGQNAIFNTPSYVNKDMDAMIDAAGAAAVSGDKDAYAKAV